MGPLIGCAASAAAIHGSASAERLFSVYPVPQGDGEYVQSYLVSKTPKGKGRYSVTYRAINIAGRKRSVWLSKASVSCGAPTSVSGDQGMVDIDPKEETPSLAYLDVHNLWWAVCRGVFHKY